MGILVDCASSEKSLLQNTSFESKLSKLEEKISAFIAKVLRDMQEDSLVKQSAADRCSGFVFVIMDVENEAARLSDERGKVLKRLNVLQERIQQLKLQIFQYNTTVEVFSEPAGAFFWGMTFSLVTQGLSWITQSAHRYLSRKNTTDNLGSKDSISETEPSERIIEQNARTFRDKVLLYKKRYTVEDYERQLKSLIKKRDDTRIQWEAAKKETGRKYMKMLGESHIVPDGKHFPLHPRVKDIAELNTAKMAESKLVKRLNKLELRCAQTQIIVQRFHIQMAKGAPPNMSPSSNEGMKILQEANKRNGWDRATDNLPYGWGAIINMQGNNTAIV